MRPRCTLLTQSCGILLRLFGDASLSPPAPCMIRWRFCETELPETVCAPDGRPLMALSVGGNSLPPPSVSLTASWTITKDSLLTLQGWEGFPRPSRLFYSFTYIYGLCSDIVRVPENPGYDTLPCLRHYTTPSFTLSLIFPRQEDEDKATEERRNRKAEGQQPRQETL